MNIDTNSERSKRHEDSINALMIQAGLNPVKITCEDRLRGAILSAMSEIEAGRSVLAFTTLQEALNL